MSVLRDHTHQRFGRLLVLLRGDNRGGRPWWLCRCDCGRELTVAASSLRTGNTRSCGCLAAETKRSMHLVHGHSAAGHLSATYTAWGNMVRRGQGKAAREIYADRGITVCQRWLTFEHFLADMGERPSELHSIDRIDNDGNYEPSNCRWATRTEQNRNKRNNRRIAVDGVLLTVAEWAEKKGQPATMIHARLRRGWTGPAAVLTPPETESWAARRSRQGAEQ